MMIVVVIWAVVCVVAKTQFFNRMKGNTEEEKAILGEAIPIIIFKLGMIGSIRKT